MWFWIVVCLSELFALLVVKERSEQDRRWHQAWLRGQAVLSTASQCAVKLQPLRGLPTRRGLFCAEASGPWRAGLAVEESR